MNKVVPASVLRLARTSEKREPAPSEESVIVPANDSGSQPEQDPIVTLRQEFLKHMALSKAYGELLALSEEAGEKADNEADAAEVLRSASLYLQPSTLLGIVASLEWFREDFEHFHVKGKNDPDPADRWGLKMLEGSIDALRQIVAKKAA